MDKGIVELCNQFNRLGLKTKFSCQGDGYFRKPYITFTCNEDNLHNIIKSIYKLHSKYNEYLDIGCFTKSCYPVLIGADIKDIKVSINDDWNWSGSSWDRDDYQNKIDIFTSYLSAINN